MKKIFLVLTSLYGQIRGIKWEGKKVLLLRIKKAKKEGRDAKKIFFFLQN
jgi:hypothetical protein